MPVHTSPMPSSSARTCLPPTAARRTLTLFSAMFLFQSFVELGDHYRLDRGQKLCHRKTGHAQRLCQCQCRAQVPADDRAGWGNA